MAAARIKVRFSDTVDAGAMEGFEVIIGMFGKTYRISRRELVILPDPNPKRLTVLKAQLDAWVNDGALSWSDAT